jgi:hypothetical protein
MAFQMVIRMRSRARTIASMMFLTVKRAPFGSGSTRSSRRVYRGLSNGWQNDKHETRIVKDDLEITRDDICIQGRRQSLTGVGKRKLHKHSSRPSTSLGSVVTGCWPE